jgi:ABC-type glycerol-3-phosphate transport system substrate-binding protein
MNMRKCTELFCQGGAAVVITPFSPFWENMKKLRRGISPDMVALAPVPGVPFIGGSSLVIWLHSYKEEAAVKLVRHLVSPTVQWSMFQNAGESPTRADMLASEPFTTDRFLHVVVHSLKTGRPFHSSRKWAVIEIQLSPALSGLFAELEENPDLDLKIAITRHFSYMQKSIEQSMLRTHPLM